MLFRTIFLLFSLSFASQSILIVYPDANLSQSDKLNASDVDAIYFLFQEGFSKYSKYKIIETEEKHFCSSSECAKSLADDYEASKVVTSKIRVLGTKIIFTGMIMNADGSDEFMSRVTALNVEDMENASLRLAKSLINKDSIEDSADIDNIIEEETVADKRREGIYKVGFSLGYLIPFGGEGYKYFDDDDGSTKLSKTILQGSWLNYWELKENKFLLGEMFFNASRSGAEGFGLELNMNKYLNKDDTSPFYGFGIGWYMNTKISNIYLNTGSGWNPDYWDYELEPRHGVALTAQAGYTLMRTYNTNIIGRIKYHALLTTGEGNIDNGISFNVGIVRKITPNQNVGNRTSNSNRVEYRFPILEILLGLR